MSNFKERFIHRPASYSFFSSWEWNREDWYDKYILNKEQKQTPAMAFGNVVGDSIGTPNSLVPTLQPAGVKEYKFTGEVEGIHLVGFADHFCDKTLVLHENKTSDNPKKWTQKSVNEHKQIDMYLLLLFLSKKIKPEDVTCYLNWIPVERGGDMLYKLPEPPTYVQYRTKRNGVDLLRYAQHIVDTVKEMELYVKLRELQP